MNQPEDRLYELNFCSPHLTSASHLPLEYNSRLHARVHECMCYVYVNNDNHELRKQKKDADGC